MPEEEMKNDEILMLKKENQMLKELLEKSERKNKKLKLKRKKLKLEINHLKKRLEYYSKKEMLEIEQEIANNKAKLTSSLCFDREQSGFISIWGKENKT